MSKNKSTSTKCVASRLPYDDFIDLAEEVGKSGMNMNDYLYKLIKQRKQKAKPVEVVKVVTKEVPKEVIKYVDREVIKEIIKEVPKEVVKIEYRERVVTKEVPKEVIKYVDREVIKEVVKIKEVPKEIVKIEYRDRVVTKEVPKEVIKYVDREVFKIEYRDCEVIQKPRGELDTEVWTREFKKLYGDHYEKVIDLVYSTEFVKIPYPYRDEFKYLVLEYLSKKRNRFFEFEQDKN